MRQRINDRSKKTPPAVLEKNFKEIVVGSGRSQEPYIIAFHYSSDNVASQGLGTLFGFFEVEIHDQDAAYIVNFLASVAKKEYFANPRRSPVESFESALHKINVALAEIIKHGNVSWLGHLHGAIGTVSENALHFSVTGEGDLYLAREETFHSISDGLANTDNEPHPLKTFTEVSSGELYDADLIFAFSPSVWSLFSPDDLKRSLSRLGPTGFEQFLRTALVNELPVAAVVLLVCSVPIELATAEKKEGRPKKAAIGLENVWSGKPFLEALQSKTEPRDETNSLAVNERGREAYTDKQTGHIYVQASPDELFEKPGNRWGEHWALFRHRLETNTRVWKITLRKTTRRVGKETSLAFDALSTWTALGQRSIGRRIRTAKRSFEEKIRDYRSARPIQKTEIPPEAVQPTEAPLASTDPPVETVAATEERVSEQNPPTAPSTLSSSVQLRLRERFSRLSAVDESAVQSLSQEFRENLSQIVAHSWLWMKTALTALPSKLGGFWGTLGPKEKWSSIAVAAGILVVTTIFFVRSETPAVNEAPAPALVDEPTTPSFPPVDEPLSVLFTENRVLAPDNGSKSIALMNVDDAPFLVTEKSIVSLKTQESIAAPESIHLATAMNDLDAIFMLGESGSLYLYSVTNKKLQSNALPLPAGAKIDALGAYLTYLYVLDQKAGVIYRFPRAEGGFGAPVTWSKESVDSGENHAFAVYENIVTADTKGSLVLYARGKNTGTAFGGTRLFYSADALAFDTKTGDLLALDRYNKRIIRWSATGTLLAQYYQESFADAETFSVSPDGSELFVSNQSSSSAWKIQ